MIKKSILTTVFLFLVNYTFSQEKFDVSYKQTSLQQVIVDLEAKTTFIFSYSKEVIHKKEITLTREKVSIKNILPELTQQTGLLFEVLSNKQIIISKPRRICGYIIDANTNETLAYTNVIINSKLYTTTDESGFFSFENPPKNSEKISLTLLGYQDKEVTLSTNDSCITIHLHPQSSQLDEVVVLGYITSGIDRNKDGSISVDSKKLGILPGLVSPDISQSIQLIPGISTLDESATGIQIRGGSPDQNLILYDNIKLYNTGYFYGMFSLFNPFATEKATIFRSGTSASYGDRISGIIDISSGTDIPKKTEGGFEIDGLSVNGYVKTALSNKLAVYAFARRSYNDIVKTPTYNSYEDKIFTNFGVVKDINGTPLVLETDDDYSPETSTNDFSFADFNSKIIYKPNEKNTISLSGLYTRNRLDFNFTGGDEKLIDSLKTQNKGLSFNWTHISNEKQKEKLTAYYSEYNSLYQNNEIKDETGNGILDLAEINIRKNDIIDFGLNFTSTTQIKDFQQLTLGYQLSYTDLNVLISKENPVENKLEQSIQDDTNLKNALFGEYTFSFKNKGFVNGGLRFVHYSSLNKFLVEPRINLEYPITSSLRFKTALEKRNQPISQLVEFNHTELRLENELWRLSDGEQFPLLSSNQISGGLLYHHKNLNIDVDTYYKELDGLTTFTSGFSNPLENLEKGESIIKGLDVLLKYKWDHYKIWAGYTFNDITFKFPNLKDTSDNFPGNNDITHHFRISNTLQLKNWQFSLGWQFRSGKPITPVNSYVIKIDADGEPAGVVNFGAINSERLPDFHRLDASILHDFNINTRNKKLKAQLGISFLNLYNRVKPLNLIYKAERKPLDDGGIAVEGTTGSTPEELEVILEQVIQRFSLGFTPNAVFRIYF
ncbi:MULTISPECIES: TonB-dependent receptor [unclassified Tenacibaculum]|uniref:TonB-dependent receptor n=1 Tax=unclassified Tenacibaculum TaxID=2635139 RepID=UPI001F40C37C|nr:MULTISPECIES: TonB-dependent receptor [unclassified Tenacibaculum]MCF2875216.1 TonB-dependent receptor [Tenacibaculum sp. Cn5-1]MCF2935292.1 TonB-dependent receptor [Tenacibaculum sp. Cn5-34]MCG7511266.1 TonB-dependent receptor [Tenacibaculum sp. Cn5-46]